MLHPFTLFEGQAQAGRFGRIGFRGNPSCSHGSIHDLISNMSSGLWWGFWRDYPKVVLNGRTYAQIGNRLYTEHAVDRFLPSGRRSVGNVPVAQNEGGGHMFHDKARSIPPAYVEEAIVRGMKKPIIENSEQRTIHVLGDLEVVTTETTRL